MSQVKTEANDIASKGSNPSASQYYSKYKDWMENDSYHLYTLLRSSSGAYLSPNSANNWLELRIINVGQHDGDGSGLTFESVYALTTIMPMYNRSSDMAGSTYIGSANYNWSTTDVFRYLNGNFMNTLSDGLNVSIKQIAKSHMDRAITSSSCTPMSTTSKIWLLSNAERLSSNSFGNNSVYDFYDLYNKDGKYFAWDYSTSDPTNNWVSRNHINKRDGSTLTIPQDGNNCWGAWSRDLGRMSSASGSKYLSFGFEDKGGTLTGTLYSGIRDVVGCYAIRNWCTLVPAFAL